MSDEKRGRGQPPHKPTDKQRQTVQVLKANGNPHKVIALVIGIDEKTLMKHYRAELDSGKDNIKALMGAAVVKSGLGGNVAAQKYWLACFGGAEWKYNADGDAVLNGAGTTIIVRGGLASVQQEPPKTNGHDNVHDKSEQID